MGWRDWFIGKLGGVTRSEFDDVKAQFKAHGSFVELIQSYFDAGEREDDIELQQAYERNPNVYRCVSAISEACAQVPFKFYRKNRDGEEQEVTDHPAAEVYNFVNEEETTIDLEEATHGWLALRGEAYWLLEKAGERIRSIRVLSPERITVVPASAEDFKRTGSRIAGYDYPVDGRSPIKLYPDEVISFRQWSPYRDLRGHDLLNVAKETLKADWRLRRRDWRFLHNFPEPGAFIESEHEVGDEYFRRLLRQIKQQHRGVDKSGEVAMIDAGMKWVVKDKPSDLGYTEGRKSKRAEMLMIWGVPPLIAGVGDDAKYDTAPSQERAFWLLTIAPRLIKHARQRTEKFLRMFPNTQGMYCQYDLTQVPAFIQMMIEFMKELETVSYLTDNEKRAMVKRAALPGANAIYKPLSLVPVAGEVNDGRDASASTGQRVNETAGERQETGKQQRLRRI